MPLQQIVVTLMSRRFRSSLLAAAAAATLIVASCGKPPITGDAAAASSVDASTDTTMTSETSTESEPPSPTSEPTETEIETETEAPTVTTTPDFDDPADMDATYVYFVVETRTGFRLARELRDLPDMGGRLEAAIEAMIQGPEDPDYLTSWNPATKVLGVEAEYGNLTVNLSAEAKTANVGTAGAAMMMPQLVWTITEASGYDDGEVTLQIDGQDVSEMWGAVSWDGPVTREAPEEVRMLLQLDRPRHGASVTSPVEISGDAAAFEANVLWRVLDSAGAEVESGFTMTTEAGVFSPFAFTVDLRPGEYTVEIIEDDASDGEGGPPFTDTRSFTVTG